MKLSQERGSHAKGRSFVHTICMPVNPNERIHPATVQLNFHAYSGAMYDEHALNVHLIHLGLLISKRHKREE